MTHSEHEDSASMQQQMPMTFSPQAIALPSTPPAQQTQPPKASAFSVSHANRSSSGVLAPRSWRTDIDMRYQQQVGAYQATLGVFNKNQTAFKTTIHSAAVHRVFLRILASESVHYFNQQMQANATRKELPQTNSTATISGEEVEVEEDVAVTQKSHADFVRLVLGDCQQIMDERLLAEDVLDDGYAAAVGHLAGYSLFRLVADA